MTKFISCKKPFLFGLLIAIAHLLATIPALRRAHWDTSIFIHAGDYFVDPSALSSPIIVRPHSLGYDGQFYYGLALHSLPSANTTSGVRMDGAAYRGQRILYPLLARLASVGKASWLPVALFAVNLCGIAVIAAAAWGLARTAGFPLWLPLAIALWPGWILTLTSDTTEIVPEVFILAGLWALAGSRAGATATALALAPLARETAIVAPLGFLANAAWRWLKQPSWARAMRVAAWAAATVPALAWQATLILGLGLAAGGGAGNIGWPFLGPTRTIGRAIGPSFGLPPLSEPLAHRLVFAAIALPLFGLLVAVHVRPAMRHTRWSPVAAAWTMVAALMTLLTAGGPWINDLAIYRAFTTCYTLGVVVLAAGGAGWRIGLPLVATAAVGWHMGWHAALDYTRL